MRDDYDRILFSRILNPGEKFSMQNNLLPISKLKARYYNRNFPLASPPFNIGDLAIFDFKADNVFSLLPDTNSKYSLSNPGIYHLQTDTSSKDGLTILIFEDNFPTPGSAEQLIESLRYLTTREEYNKLLQSNDKKKAVDEYWLHASGNRERARKLIREYYTRVQEANRLFTSYLEGWKTDRGMIYIIFGPPQTIYRDDKNEQWTYGSANNLPDIDFIFEHVKNPFTNEDYNLKRSPVYETPWYMAVDEWRNGRVVNDY
jgi:GWxTD domain-containing protein